MLGDLKETFDNLRVYKMMLNPAKCVFGVPAGTLLGFLVSERGIEANPEKIKAITSLSKPACVNDVQRLARRIAALSRFISRLGEKAMPLYQLMKNTDNFVWSDAADEAFEALKKQLAEPPVLAAPIDKEPLLLYVAANNKAVSVAVVIFDLDLHTSLLSDRGKLVLDILADLVERCVIDEIADTDRVCLLPRGRCL